MVNLATSTRPEGGALRGVVERFIGAARQTANSEGAEVDEVIERDLRELNEFAGGCDLSSVIKAYWHGTRDGDRPTMEAALQWLRGEFHTKTDARKALGVRDIIDDSEVYDYWKMLGRFVRLGGYSGLVIMLDEMVNLLLLSNTPARRTNYEKILRIVNDALQGTTEGFGIYFGGTPEFLTDTRRGLYSYEALESRLAENLFAGQAGVRDFHGPVLRLPNLSPEELFLLLARIRTVQASGNPSMQLVPDEAIKAFMAHCNKRIGAAFFQTPRNSIKAWVDLLSVLEQAPDLQWHDLLEEVKIKPDEGDLKQTAELDGSESGDAEELHRFQL
jgi:hypothetical protein